MPTAHTDTQAPGSPHLASTGRDRRRHARLGFVRACKVQRAGEVRYEVGQTTNISASGALVRVAGAQPVRIGERLRVGVAWEAAGVLESGSMIPARVVRVIPIDFNHQAVAVEYDRPLAGEAPISVAA